MTYLDMYHVKQYEGILEAFRVLNSTLAGQSGGLAWAPEILVQIDDEKYARCYYMDGQAYIEPLYNPVREDDDR